LGGKGTGAVQGIQVGKPDAVVVMSIWLGEEEEEAWWLSSRAVCRKKVLTT
jgi:hypothetical protein